MSLEKDQQNNSWNRHRRLVSNIMELGNLFPKLSIDMLECIPELLTFKEKADLDEFKHRITKHRITKHYAQITTCN